MIYMTHMCERSKTILYIKKNIILKWIGFNLEYGDLDNGNLEAILISKITVMGISKKATVISNLVSKTGISKNRLGTFENSKWNYSVFSRNFKELN